MKKPKLDLFLFFSIIATFLGILFIVGSLIKILRTSDYFKIRDIMASEDNLIDLSYFKGKNMFTIDLQRESGYIAKQNPAYRKIRLVRLLPNRLFIDYIKRKPIAIIKLYRYFFVDEEGVVFDVTEEQGSEYTDLPLILGLEIKIFGPHSGQKYDIKELSLALNIAKEIKDNRALKDYKLKRINVANLNNASFFLLPKNPAVTRVEGLEVKFGADNIREKFNVLTGLLTQDKNNLANIEYIDLRFKEPVIKLRNVK